MRVVHPDRIEEAGWCEPTSSERNSRMNVHKNARTTPRSRALLIHLVVIEKWPVAEVAMSTGISERTVYKWLARYRAVDKQGRSIDLATDALVLAKTNLGGLHHEYSLAPALT